MSRAARRAMVKRDHPALSVSRQCRLLSIGRSSLSDTPRGERAETLALMRRIDELFLKYPFYGIRQMVRHLRREGVRLGRRQADRLMRLMGLQAIYRAPRTSEAHPEHRVYPYLLKGLAIERANQVWCADLTYIPVRRGFLYLVAVMDWASQHVLASMDGRGRCMDNIFIERLWRSLKDEAVYLRDLADGFEARRVIGEWIGFSNTERPHSALGGRTPAEAYCSDPPVDMWTSR